VAEIGGRVTVEGREARSVLGEGRSPIGAAAEGEEEVIRTDSVVGDVSDMTIDEERALRKRGGEQDKVSCSRCSRSGLRGKLDVRLSLNRHLGAGQRREVILADPLSLLLRHLHPFQLIPQRPDPTVDLLLPLLEVLLRLVLHLLNPFGPMRRSSSSSSIGSSSSKRPRWPTSTALSSSCPASASTEERTSTPSRSERVDWSIVAGRGRKRLVGRRNRWVGGNRRRRGSRVGGRVGVEEGRGEFRMSGGSSFGVV
jgi:hypothetical protein